MNRRKFFGGGLTGLLGLFGLRGASAASQDTTGVVISGQFTDGLGYPVLPFGVTCPIEAVTNGRADWFDRVLEGLRRGLKSRQTNPHTRVNLSEFEISVVVRAKKKSAVVPQLKGEAVRWQESVGREKFMEMMASPINLGENL